MSNLSFSHLSANRQTVAIAALSALMLVAGCRIDTNTDSKGANVKIATPFGGMSVKTDEKAAVGTGLPTYPGAVIDHDKRSDDNYKHDSGAADVDMSFGSFQLRVKAVTYRTTDPPAKVLAFYRSGLARFGSVIECSGDHPIGTPTSTPDGLTCRDDDTTNLSHTYSVSDSDSKDGVTVTHKKGYNVGSHSIELKAGSKRHQHIVSIDPDGTGTKFGLIALDLPGKFPFGDDSDDSSKSDKSQQPE